MAVATHRLTHGIGARWHAVRRRYKWWQLTLFVIGVDARSCLVMSALFFAVGRKPERVYTDSHAADGRLARFCDGARSDCGRTVEDGGTIHVLNNGDEFVPALLEAINQAQRTINFTVYIWSEGTFSDQLLAALEKKQREGVEVRMLLDGLGSIKVPDEDFEPLIAAGGKVQKFRTPKFGKLTRFHRRNHRRSIVIDGDVGFTGGMAVSDIWLGHAQDTEHWRDMMFKVTGPMARSLQTAFVDLWVSSSGELLIDPKHYPVPAGVDARCRAICSPGELAGRRRSVDGLFLPAADLLGARIHLLCGAVLHPRQLSAVGAGRQGESGVDVRLLLPGPHTDNWITRASAQARYQELLEAGAKIYEYEPTFMHAKYRVIDGKWSIIGSPNLNSRSRELDEENALGIYDPGFGASSRRRFSTI